MEIFFSVLLIVAMITAFHPLQERPKDEIMLDATPPNIENVLLRYRVEPLSEYQWKYVVRQKYDYSCGAASLSTILKYYLGENLEEQDVVNGLFKYGDTAQIERERAFSLLDMKKYVSKLGYNVAGYTADIEDLKSLGMPCIIPINVFEYKHFVVFRGIYKDHVFTGDPFQGNYSYTIEKFKEIWFKNIVFIVSNGGDELDNLILTDQDLRIVNFDMTVKSIEAYNPKPTASDERLLMESTGKVFYKIN